MKIVLPGIFEADPDIRYRPPEGFRTHETVVVILHGGDTAGLLSPPRSSDWGPILRVDISKLDAGQSVLRACEVVGHRRELRCGQSDILSAMAHSEDARVLFRQDGESMRVSVGRRVERRRLIFLPMEPGDSMPVTVEGITLWKMPSTVTGFSRRRRPESELPFRVER